MVIITMIDAGVMIAKRLEKKKTLPKTGNTTKPYQTSYKKEKNNVSIKNKYMSTKKGEV